MSESKIKKFIEGATLKLKEISLGPGRMTYTEKEIIIENGETKVILSKDSITFESPKIVTKEIKKD